MAYSSREIVDYLLANPEMDDAQIVKAMETYSISPAQMAQAVNMQEGEIAARVAATLPPNQAVLLGDTYVQAVNQVIGSGQDQQVGALENVITYKADDNQAGGNINYFSPTGEFQQTTKQQEVAGSFLGGLAEAFNDPVVQAAFLGLGGGGALGNALGLTGSTAQAVGTGLFKGGTALAGGADLEDALASGLLSGGLVYGGNALNNYLTTGSAADVGLTDRQFAILDATQLANQGLTTPQIIDTLSAGGYNDAIIDRAITAITPTTVATTPVSTPVTDGVTITAPTTPSLNNVLSTIAATTPIPVTPAPVAVSTPVTDTVNITGTTQPQITTQQVIDLVNSQLVANVGTPVTSTTVPTQTITAPSNNVTTQGVINAIAATVPTVIQPPTVTTPTTIPTTTVPTTTITADRPVTTPEVINTVASTLTPTVVTPTTTPTTTTTPTDIKETDPVRIVQLALAAAGLLGAGSALSNTPTPTGFDIVPVPTDWKTPPPTGVAPFTPLTPIDFGNRNLLMGTQWEKFLDPNYGQVPEPIQYSQPSNMSYSDLMGILGSKQGMPSRSTLSINDIISGIQNQYGQTPVSTVG
jgi:hypothetical protein